MDGVDEAVFLRRTPTILVRAVGTAETRSSADGRVRREMINSAHPAQRTSDFAASRTTTESRSCRGACMLLRARFRMAAWRSGCRLLVRRLPARRPWLAGPSPMRSPRQSRWLPGCGRCPARLAGASPPGPFREDDLQALVRLLPIHERPSDSGPSPATAVATLATVPRRPAQPSAQPGTAPTSRSARARERAHNHRIRSNAVTRKPPGARWRTAPAPPRRRSDRPARLRGSRSGWDRCARPSCAEPGTARRGTWCSRPAP